jgi:hypothetical protein
VYYAMQPPTEEATPDLSMVREERARQRELGMMMGQSGVLLADIEAALERPVAGAALIAAGGALFSFFRAAWVIEAEERDARRDAGHD